MSILTLLPQRLSSMTYARWRPSSLWIQAALSFILLATGCGGSDSAKRSGQTSIKGNGSAESGSNQSPYIAQQKFRYTRYTLLSKYRGEQSLGVKYFSPKERESLSVSVRDGLLIDHRGEPLDAHLDDKSNANRTGKAIYVISIDGLLWVCFDQRYGFIHHSSLLAGAPVLAAGELVLDQGQLLSISNSSGHYKPDMESLDVALKILKTMGVDLKQTERLKIGPTGLPFNKRLRKAKPRGE